LSLDPGTPHSYPPSLRFTHCGSCLAIVVAIILWSFRDSVRGLVARAQHLTVEFIGRKVTLQAGEKAKEIVLLRLEVADLISGLSKD